MEARRAAIIAAQLASRGLGKEQACWAVDQGPEAIAALNADMQMETLTIDFAADPQESMAHRPVVDASWMFPNATTACISADPPQSMAHRPPIDVSWMFPNASSESPSAPNQVASSVPGIDIAWMFDNPTLSDEAMAQEVGVVYANEVGIAVEAFECQCCLDEVPEMTGVQMSPGVEGCDHALCPECFKRLIEGQIENKEACICPVCPATSPSVVPSWLVRRVLGDVMAMRLSEIEQIHLDKTDGGQMRLWQCPTPDCTNRQVVDADWDPQQVLDGERIVDCQVCTKRICVRCNVEEHQGFTCQQFREWRQANDSSEQSFANMMERGLIKPCPNCAAPILKTEGCNFMTCPTCNDPNRMCWQTGKKRYGPDGCGGGHNCH